MSPLVSYFQFRAIGAPKLSVVLPIPASAGVNPTEARLVGEFVDPRLV